MRVLGLLLIVALPVLLAACGGTTDGSRTGDDVRDDEWIATAIGMMFIQDEVLRDRQYRIECYNGKVILSGVLYSEEERKRAVNIPRYVGGVRDIVDRFEIRPSPN